MLFPVQVQIYLDFYWIYVYDSNFAKAINIIKKKCKSYQTFDANIVKVLPVYVSILSLKLVHTISIATSKSSTKKSKKKKK